MDKLNEYYKRGDKLNTLKEGLVILNKSFVPIVFFIVSTLYIFNDELIHQLENIELDGDNKVYIYFGIAKNYELKKNYTKAYQYYKLGNLAKYEMVKNTYFMKDEYSKFDILKDMNIPNIDDICDKKIIFIVGMPRCGSTLLSKIINYNNKFKDISENFNINDIIGTVKNNLLDYKDKVKSFVDKTYDDNIIDKTLTNFEFIGVIRQVFPNAKIIHLKRNKMHHLWSNFTHIYSNGLKYTYDWEMMNNYHNYYIKYMDHWNNKYDDILNVQFEDILSDSDTVLKEIFEYIEEDFDERCYDFYKKTDQNNTVSNFQVKEPLQKNKVDKFEEYRELFESDDVIREIFFK